MISRRHRLGKRRSKVGKKADSRTADGKPGRGSLGKHDALSFVDRRVHQKVSPGKMRRQQIVPDESEERHVALDSEFPDEALQFVIQRSLPDDPEVTVYPAAHQLE